VLVIGAGAAWLTRDRWYPALRDGDRAVVEAPLEAATDSGAERAAARIRSLSRPSGPAYVNISPADLAALMVREASNRGPLPLKNVTAGVVRDRLWVRGTLELKELRGQGALGALGALLGDEENVEQHGTLEIVSPGVAQFRVEGFKARNLAVPSAAIPRIIRHLQPDRAPGVSPDGVAFPVPPHIGDVRIGNGRITLYKTAASS
jgi:hypothetical protein